MTKPQPPKNVFSLTAEQITNFFSREWKKFRNELNKAYRDDLPLSDSPNDSPLSPFSNMAKVSFNALNKTRRKVQQRFKQKDNIHIRNQTEDKK